MVILLNKEYMSVYGLPVVSSVDSEIFTLPYPSINCLEMGCKDMCCKGGAIMDSITYTKLKNHAQDEMFMNIDWSEPDFTEDPYYPGGLGCYTKIAGDTCIFRNKDANGCSIHTYCLKKGIDFRELKFFACCIFPCEINTISTFPNVLTAGYELRNPGYDFPCKATGLSSVYECSKNDIMYYFGDKLIAELEEIRLGLFKHNQSLLERDVNYVKSSTPL